MVEISKSQLEKTWNWLKENKITPENLKWLKRHRPEIWSGYPESVSGRIQWERENTKTVLKLSLRIQDILDAEKKIKVRNYTFGKRLSKTSLTQLAERLDISIPKRTTKRALLNMILEEIEERKREKRKLSFECG